MVNEELLKKIEWHHLYADFYDSETKAYFDKMRDYRLFIEMFKNSYKTLRRTFDFHNSGVEYPIWSKENQKLKSRIRVQITSLLYNYLNVVKDTIEFSRTIPKNELFEKKLKSRNTENSEDPIHKFFIQLRNYISHAGVINFSTALEANYIKGVRKYFYIEVNPLENKVAKNVIEALKKDNKIIIDSLIDQHYQKFLQDQLWIYVNYIQQDLTEYRKHKSVLNKLAIWAKEIDIKDIDHFYLALNRYLNYLKI